MKGTPRMGRDWAVAANMSVDYGTHVYTNPYTNATLPECKRCVA